MRAGDVFSHSTAAMLWGAPFSIRFPETIHVSATTPQRAPESQGIIGHQTTFAARDVRTLFGLRVVSPALAWAQTAGLVTIDDLVAVGDFMVTPAFGSSWSLAGIQELLAISKRLARQRGHRWRTGALPLIRVGPLSRPESFVRLLVASVGIPEPELNVMSEVAMPDLRWAAYKFCVDYEGDQHREKDQFRRDVRRTERLIDAGWLVIRVTADDLYDRPAELVTRVAARLASRGWDGSLDLRHMVVFTR